MEKESLQLRISVFSPLSTGLDMARTLVSLRGMYAGMVVKLQPHYVSDKLHYNVIHFVQSFGHQATFM